MPYLCVSDSEFGGRADCRSAYPKVSGLVPYSGEESEREPDWRARRNSAKVCPPVFTQMLFCEELVKKKLFVISYRNDRYFRTIPTKHEVEDRKL